ncbi:MAG: hypothetical protein AAGA70_02340 [Pseudomonadota bacterium]
MSFVRPELAASLRRWREVLTLIALALIGLWIALRPGFFLPIAGWVMVAGAVILLPASIRRARFQPGNEGPGVVKVSEGRIAYLGPVTGGTASLYEIDVLALCISDGLRVWRLSTGPDVLDVPVDALGGDQLFDAFVRLPGLSADRLLAATRAPAETEITLWRRHQAPALTPT